MRQNLIETSLRVRVDISPRWGPRTIHDRYTFDPENPANGQCGISSDEMTRRLGTISHYAMILDGVMQGERVLSTRPNGRPGGESYDATAELHEFIQNNPESVQRVRELGHELVGMAFACDYGDMINNDTDEIISDDHCWVRIAKPEQLADPTKGMVDDITPDQFSTPSLELPPIVAQAANAQDKLVRYRTRKSTPLGVLNTYDSDRLAQMRRRGALVGGLTPFREWLLQSDTSAHHKSKYERLKTTLQRFEVS